MTEELMDNESGDAFKRSLEEHFGTLEDYLRQGSISYRLVDIVSNSR